MISTPLTTLSTIVRDALVLVLEGLSLPLAFDAVDALEGRLGVPDRFGATAAVGAGALVCDGREDRADLTGERADATPHEFRLEVVAALDDRVDPAASGLMALGGG